MKITDPIGDMITRIRNGQMRGLKKVSVPGSKLRKAVLDVLQKEGFIQEYTVSKDKSFETIEINLKYMYGDPVIKEIERVSRPGRRIYSRSDSIQKIQNGLGISIVPSNIAKNNHDPEIGFVELKKVNLKTDNDGLYTYTHEKVEELGLIIHKNTTDLYSSEFADEVLSIKTHYERIYLKHDKNINYIQFSFA